MFNANADISAQGKAAMPDAKMAMNRLLNPKSIAIVGASPDAKSLSRWMLKNISLYNYKGELHLVSRRRVEIEGKKCVPTIDDLPDGVDVAMLSIPQSGVLDAVKAAGRRKIAVVVIFSSGFAETGDEGRKAQDEIAQAARDAGVYLVGPNCLGLVNFKDGIPLAMDPMIFHAPDEEKCVGIIAQSGATANNMRDAAIGRRLSLAYSISTGNEASLGVEDFLEALIEEKRVAVISIYAEQIRNPKRFLKLAQAARKADKAIVLLMPGRSERAKHAAQSHTGALTGDRAVAKVLLEREGVAFVDTLDELFDVTAILLRYPNPPAMGPALMTNSGALKNLALDLADEVGLPFPPINKETAQILTQMLPDFAEAENPLDYTTMGGSNPGAIGEFTKIMSDDANIGGLIVSVMGGPEPLQMDKAKHLVPPLAEIKKPAALVIMGDNIPLVDPFLDEIKKAGVPFFRSTDRAIRAFAKVRERGIALERLKAKHHFDDNAPIFEGENTIAEYEGKHYLQKLGIEIPKGGLAKTAQEAAQIGAQIGFPVVAKAQHAKLMHKSDVGGVKVGIKDEEDLKRAFDEIVENVKFHKPEMVLDCILIEGMAQKGLELVVGASRDIDWGPVTLVGLGGIWIEALGDVRILPADASVEFIIEELQKLKGVSMLKGIRGQDAVDENKIAQIVAAIGAFMIKNPQISEIDINPLMAYKDKAIALDALIVGRD